MARITELFTDHPASVDETYLEHMVVASGFSLKLFGLAVAALVHAILPFLFVTTASTTVLAMAEKMANRRNLAASNALGLGVPGAATARQQG